MYGAPGAGKQALFGIGVGAQEGRGGGVIHTQALQQADGGVAGADSFGAEQAEAVGVQHIVGQSRHHGFDGL